jgi:hypothetical protein
VQRDLIQHFGELSSHYFHFCHELPGRQETHLAVVGPPCVPERRSRRRRLASGDARGFGAKDFALYRFLDAMTYSSADCLLLNLGPIPFPSVEFTSLQS